jgi:hypothetical protein
MQPITRDSFEQDFGLAADELFDDVVRSAQHDERRCHGVPPGVFVVIRSNDPSLSPDTGVVVAQP